MLKLVPKSDNFVPKPVFMLVTKDFSHTFESCIYHLKNEIE